MKTASLVGPFLCGVAAVAADPSRAQGPGADVRRHLQALSSRSVFFGHQSVGTNLLEGLRDLAAREGVDLRIAEGPSRPGALGHGFLAENGDPARKLRSFEEALAAGAAPDLALMKFCYVDFGAQTDAAALFARYQATLRGLKARMPRTTFVHVTAPLTTVQGGVRALAKRVLGRPPGGLLENARREEFNALLRGAYRGREPVFDLAQLESTAPDGSAVAVRWQGRDVPALAPAYTDDGGHLNAAGRLAAARGLVEVLASAPAAPAGQP